MNRLFILFIIALNIVACSSTGPYQLSKTTDADGLANVENGTLDEIAIRPQQQFSQYKKVLIEPVSVAYSKQRRSDSLNRNPDDFKLDEKELEIFNSKFVKAFQTNWGEKLGWELTDTRGPNVIIVRANITDFYLYASIKNDNILPTRSFANETSKMVLNLQLIDSQTNTILLRTKDKKTTGISNASLTPIRMVNSVTYWSDAYQAFKQWAATLSTYLT